MRGSLLRDTSLCARLLRRLIVERQSEVLVSEATRSGGHIAQALDDE